MCVAKHNRPASRATFATTHDPISATFECAMPLLEHSVNVGFPLDSFVRQFRFVRREVGVTVLRNELLGQSDGLRLGQLAFLRIRGDTQREQRNCRSDYSSVIWS